MSDNIDVGDFNGTDPDPVATSPIDWEAMAAASAQGAEQAKRSKILVTVTCNTPTCKRRGQWHPVYSDQVGPLLCGECGGSLHCDHTEQATRTLYEGTLAAPSVVNVHHCRACGVEFGRDARQISLSDIPVAALLGGRH